MTYCQQHGQPIITHNGQGFREECEVCQLDAGLGEGPQQPEVGQLVGKVWFTVSKSLLAEAQNNNAINDIIAEDVKRRVLALIKNPPADFLQEVPS